MTSYMSFEELSAAINATLALLAAQIGKLEKKK
jgi:hypothetical protein